MRAAAIFGAQKPVNLKLKNSDMIPKDLLLECGAQQKTYKKGAIIFTEGNKAQYYFQMLSGEVKTNNYNDEGKEFIQGIFTEGDSFGEPTLLNGKTYPANAEAITDSQVLVLPKSAFFKMFEEHPQTAISLCARLADRLYYKALIASEMAFQDPEHRLLALFDFLKYEVAKCSREQRYEIALTRQQLADLTGIRVETVIRTVKALEKQGKVSISNRKILR